MDKTTIPIKLENDVVIARGVGRKMARDLGFGTADQTRLATAISELTRNVLRYAGEGVCVITEKSDQESVTLDVVVEDHGPGIENIDEAMTDGFTTGGGLGAGLPGTKRLVHQFNIESQPGFTKVAISLTLPRTLEHACK